MSRSIFLIILGVIFVKVDAQRRIINGDVKLAQWDNNQIPFYIDPAYSEDQQTQIRLAMLRVSGDLDMCVRFIEAPSDSPRYKIKVTPFTNEAGLNATIGQYCHTYSGKFIQAQNAGKREQPLVLSTGSHGCFDGSLHSLMKYFALVMGKRNEHQRPDRGNYIQLLPENFEPGLQVAYRFYTPNEYQTSCRYDYCSVTHNQPGDFAKSGSVAFMVKMAPYFIPKLDRLSQCDCQEIKAYYGCDPSTCEPLDCESQVPPTSPSPTLPIFGREDQTTTIATTGTMKDTTGTTVCFSSESKSTTVSAGKIITNAQATTSLSSISCTTTATVNNPTRFDVAFMGPRQKRSRTDRMSAHRVRRVANADPDFLKWPGNEVPYYIDSGYSTTQLALIEMAMRKVTVDLSGCIKFTPVSLNSTLYKIRITPQDDSGYNPGQGCRTFPGAYRYYTTSVRNEQTFVLTPGPGGCFDGSLGMLMKFFVLVLGRRNEYNRPDRDNSITINYDQVQPAWKFVFEKYPYNKIYLRYPYDFCSITHNDVANYATVGGKVFISNNPQIPEIPRLSQLSYYDCKILSDMYSCPAPCTPMNCEEKAREKADSSEVSIATTLSSSINGSQTVCFTLPTTLTNSDSNSLSISTANPIPGSPTVAISATTCAPSSPLGGTTTVAPSASKPSSFSQIQEQLAALAQQLLNQLSTSSSSNSQSVTSNTGPSSSSKAATANSDAGSTTVSTRPLLPPAPSADDLDPLPDISDYLDTTTVKGSTNVSTSTSSGSTIKTTTSQIPSAPGDPGAKTAATTTSEKTMPTTAVPASKSDSVTDTPAKFDSSADTGTITVLAASAVSIKTTTPIPSTTIPSTTKSPTADRAEMISKVEQQLDELKQQLESQTQSTLPGFKKTTVKGQTVSRSPAFIQIESMLSQLADQLGITTIPNSVGLSVTQNSNLEKSEASSGYLPSSTVSPNISLTSTKSFGGQPDQVFTLSQGQASQTSSPMTMSAVATNKEATSFTTAEAPSTNHASKISATTMVINSTTTVGSSDSATKPVAFSQSSTVTSSTFDQNAATTQPAIIQSSATTHMIATDATVPFVDSIDSATKMAITTLKVTSSSTTIVDIPTIVQRVDPSSTVATMADQLTPVSSSNLNSVMTTLAITQQIDTDKSSSTTPSLVHTSSARIDTSDTPETATTTLFQITTATTADAAGETTPVSGTTTKLDSGLISTALNSQTLVSVEPAVISSGTTSSTAVESTTSVTSTPLLPSTTVESTTSTSSTTTGSKNTTSRTEMISKIETQLSEFLHQLGKQTRPPRPGFKKTTVKGQTTTHSAAYLHMQGMLNHFAEQLGVTIPGEPEKSQSTVSIAENSENTTQIAKTTVEVTPPPLAVHY